MTTLYTPTREEFAELLTGEPRYRLDQVWSGLYTQLAAPADISNMPKALRERLAAELPTSLTQVVSTVSVTTRRSGCRQVATDERQRDVRVVG